MIRSKPFQIVAGFLVAVALLGFLRWQGTRQPRPHTEETQHQAPSAGQQQELNVAFLPVTCHLTCPVTDFASKTTTTGTRFDALRFTEFPTIIEALRAKKLLAGFITVPLAMKMREQGAPVKIVCLGHRDGSRLIVRKEDTAKNLGDLRGKTIAIPSPLSNENFFLTEMMRSQGVQPGEIKTVVLPPPDMVAALGTKSIDGFIVAEPFCTRSEIDGFGRTLYSAKDIWPNYISCCLVVHEDLIRDRPEVVRDLVRGIVDSGEWAEQNRKDAAKLAAPYFKQDEKLLTRILTDKPERVTYRNLNPSDAELQKILDIGTRLGLLKQPLTLADLVDRDFLPTQIVAPKLNLAELPNVDIKEGVTK